MPTTEQRPVTFQTAHVRTTDDTLDVEQQLDLDPVRFAVRTSTAYAMNDRGDRLWEATISGYERQGRDTVVVHLVDGPDVTATKYCRPCKQRRTSR